MTYCKPPPIGIMPERIWRMRRIEDLLAAMKRYAEENKGIPGPWADEMVRHTSFLEKTGHTE